MRAVPLRVVTFNVGLMRVRLFGHQLFENPAGVQRRGVLVPHRVRDVCRGADVVCVQECYEQEHRDALRASLMPDYPFMATSHTKTCLNSGLMTFSRHPLTSFRRVPHSTACRYERLLGDRAMLVSSIDVHGGARPVTVVNTHLSSGAPVDTPEMSSMRRQQIHDIRRVVAGEGGRRHVIVAGDFNCSPQLNPECYAEMQRIGWVDAWSTANGASSADPGITWDKANPLNENKNPIHGHSQRCDQVWIARGRVRVVGSTVVQDADPVSDHHPLVTDIELF